MPIQTTTVMIEDTEYQIAQFQATRGLKYLKKLTQLLGASIAELFSEGDMKTQTVSADGLTRAVELLVENMDKVDFEVFIKELLSATTVNNRDINFDMEFAGRYNVLFELVFEVVKYNFGSVFTKGVLGNYLPSKS